MYLAKRQNRCCTCIAPSSVNSLSRDFPELLCLPAANMFFELFSSEWNPQSPLCDNVKHTSGSPFCCSKSKSGVGRWRHSQSRHAQFWSPQTLLSSNSTTSTTQILYPPPKIKIVAMGVNKVLVYHHRSNGSPVVQGGLAQITTTQLEDILAQST